MSTVQTVNWEAIFTSDPVALSDFAYGEISLRDLRKGLPKEVKKEVTKLEKNRTTMCARNLARRALARRNFV